MKKLLFMAIAAISFGLCSCTSDSDSNGGNPPIAGLKSTVKFTNNTSMSFSTTSNNGLENAVLSKSFSNKKLYDAAEGELTTAYFFIRLDGSTPEYTQPQENYIPEGSLKQEGVNAGLFSFEENESLFTAKTYPNGVTTYRVHNDEGIPVNFASIPTLESICQGSGLPYTNDKYEVIWYEMKKGANGTSEYTNDTWNVDGKIIKKNSVTIEVGLKNISRDLFLEADDFLIRRIDNNDVTEYVDNILPQDNTVDKHGIIAEDNLHITVSELDNLDFENYKEYTYEVYLWGKPENVGNEIFSHGNFDRDELTILEAEGYQIRFDYENVNVYAGISGHNDTPYIKVSIHIRKADNK